MSKSVQKIEADREPNGKNGPSVDGHGSRKAAGRTAGRPTARRELVENEIYTHASRLFAERGFAGTNLQDIAEAMGITRPALYYYVKSKEELLAKLVAEIAEGPAAEIERLAGDSATDPVARLHEIAHLIAFQRASQPSRFQLLLRSEADLPPDLAKAQRDAQRNTLRSLVRVLEEGVVKGQFRPVNPRAAALAVAGMCNWVAWWHHSGDHDLTDEEVAGQVSELAVSMMRQASLRTPETPGPKAALALLRQDLDYLERVLDS
ncbi:TetR/AcrR family transcriptional regulator [Streptomyces sp. NPDC002143]